MLSDDQSLAHHLLVLMRISLMTGHMLLDWNAWQGKVLYTLGVYRQNMIKIIKTTEIRGYGRVRKWHVFIFCPFLDTLSPVNSFRHRNCKNCHPEEQFIMTRLNLIIGRYCVLVQCTKTILMHMLECMQLEFYSHGKSSSLPYYPTLHHCNSMWVCKHWGWKDKLHGWWNQHCLEISWLIREMNIDILISLLARWITAGAVMRRTMLNLSSVELYGATERIPRMLLQRSPANRSNRFQKLAAMD